MNERLTPGEIRKDAAQDVFTAATHTVGSVVGIITGAVADVGKAVGGLASELYEIRDSTRRALHDQGEGTSRTD